MRLPVALGLAVLMAVSTVAAQPGPPASAAAPYYGSCVDGNFFDGLDTRSAATYCKQALDAAGYTGQRFTNTDATGPLPYEAVDAVFAHAGHALVTCETPTSTNCTAISSAFAGSSSASTIESGLLGDPTAAYYQGPAQSCTSGGGCRDVVLTNYPYNSEMTKFNLALFASCNSARDGVFGLQSLATVAFNTGNVGTAIGFRNEVAWLANKPNANVAGDAFARTFWADLKSGTTYSTALVDAVNAAGGSTYGWSSYVYKHHAGAPTRLRAAQYYVPTTATVASTSAGTGWRAQAFTDALGLNEAPSQLHWRDARVAGRTRQVATTPEGLVQVDPFTHEVTEIVFSDRLTTATGPVKRQAVLRDVADRFAADHYRGFAALRPRSVELLDHGSWTENRFVYQARRRGAWLPRQAVVGVNARTGQVAYYWSERQDVSTLVAPAVDAQRARALAAAGSGYGKGAQAGAATLQPLDVDGEQTVAWLVEVRPPFTRTRHIATTQWMRVDPQTGAVGAWAIS